LGKHHSLLLVLVISLTILFYSLQNVDAQDEDACTEKYEVWKLVGTEQFYKLYGQDAEMRYCINLFENMDATQDVEEPTYKFYSGEMPRQWVDRFGNIISDATKYWEEKNPEIKFGEVLDEEDIEDVDFFVEWASTYEEINGYYVCCSETGQGLISVTLGYFDSGEWKFVSQEYAAEVMKHEIGHFLGYEHTLDPYDLMYPALDKYEDWLKLDPTKPTKPDIILPEWIKNNAGWWADGQISDTDFVSAIEFLIDVDVIQIPETLISGEKSVTEHGYLKVHGEEFFIAEDERVEVKISGQYPDWQEHEGSFQLRLIDPSERKDRVDIRIKSIRGEFSTWLEFDHFSLMGEYTVKGLIGGNPQIVHALHSLRGVRKDSPRR